MDFFNRKLEDYLTANSQPEDAVLNELTRETHLRVLHPRMLSGPIQGKLLEIISKLIQPETILEIGTYTGYSAICLAKGLKENGMLHTFEINDEIAHLCLSFFEKAGLKDKIKLHIGDAIEISQTLNQKFDLVFIDGDKKDYLKYYEAIFPLVKPGGCIIADNVLWCGKVLEKPTNKDIDTETLLHFNKMITEDNRVENVLLPLRDGLMLIRKH